jgi:uncharacterized membrane protein YhaH (DUF805 family)
MSFQDAVRVCLGRYADFGGRARRSEYWWFIVFTAVVTTIASVVDAIVGTQFGNNYGLFQLLAALALLLPGLAVGARRLHDVGRSGWMLLILIIPVIGALILVVAYFIRDSEPDNTNGPSPKQAIA